MKTVKILLITIFAVALAINSYSVTQAYAITVPASPYDGEPAPVRFYFTRNHVNIPNAQGIIYLMDLRTELPSSPETFDLSINSNTVLYFVSYPIINETGILEGEWTTTAHMQNSKNENIAAIFFTYDPSGGEENSINSLSYKVRSVNTNGEVEAITFTSGPIPAQELNDGARIGVAFVYDGDYGADYTNSTTILYFDSTSYNSNLLTPAILPAPPLPLIPVTTWPLAIIGVAIASYCILRRHSLT